MAKSKDLTVFITRSDPTCSECGEELGRHAWITLTEERNALCLSCADLDHLYFLPAGNAALTRRSRKYSTLVAVVVEWSRARKRYERQGLLVEQEAVEQAEAECLADEDVRARRRERAARRRAELDEQYVQRFAARVRELYPGCPPGRETAIAEHACRKYSGRVGRSAAAKELDSQAIHLAVVAHIRHRETAYDELLVQGDDRHHAREEVRDDVDRVLAQWQAQNSAQQSQREQRTTAHATRSLFVRAPHSRARVGSPVLVPLVDIPVPFEYGAMRSRGEISHLAGIVFHIHQRLSALPLAVARNICTARCAPSAREAGAAGRRPARTAPCGSVRRQTRAASRAPAPGPGP